MQARSALFDLYGDHLRSYGGRAPIAALVRLLSPLGITAPTVRTAVSRMVTEGWLIAEQRPRGYALTDRALRRLDEASARIYRTQNAAWDGHWRLLVLWPPNGRSARERLRAGLEYLGYAPLGGPGWSSTWLSPRESSEVDALLASEGVQAERFRATGRDDPGELLRRAWDLDALASAYDVWLAQATAMVADHRADDRSIPADRPPAAGVPAPTDGPAVHLPDPDPDPDPDRAAYAVRCRLVHEWRKFLFSDPGLPRELLPADWAGHRAAAFFDAEATRLWPAAARYVRTCLLATGALEVRSR